MLEIIAGEKGKGKTKVLINKANDDIKVTKGTIVYLDKNNKHMYELSNRIRMINVPDYTITDSNMFLGFISGIVSQDNDLDKIFLDSFLTIAHIKEDNLEVAFLKLKEISDTFHVDFIVSTSMNKKDLPSDLQQYVTVAL